MKAVQFRFKIVTTALFLLLTLFAAGFTAFSASYSFAQPETISAQQNAAEDSLGDGFWMLCEDDGMIPS